MTTKDDEDCYIHGPGTFPHSDGCRCEKCVKSSNQCHCRACVGDHAGHGPCTLPGPSAIPCWSANPPTWHQVALKNDCAHCEIERLRGLLSKWVAYCDLSGAKPVSADVRDNPVLQLLKDSREALPDGSNAVETDGCRIGVMLCVHCGKENRVAVEPRETSGQ